MFSEKIKKTTGAIFKGEIFVGSGVIFSYNEVLYFLTAAHNIYGLQLNQEFLREQWIVEDYRNNRHSIISVNSNVEFSKVNDIALLKLTPSISIADFTTPIFTEMPANKIPEFFFRGTYARRETPVNKPCVKFLEKYDSSSHKFLCIIDKSHLTNSSFSFGSEWMGGFSGSGLFLENSKEIICAGILLEVPDKGDNGQLLFCSSEALIKLGLPGRILTKDIYNYNSDYLTDDWFKTKLDTAINALGKRYTPQLNFDLPIGKVFNGFFRNAAFKRELDQYFEKIFKHTHNSYTAQRTDFLVDKISAFNRALEHLKEDYLSTEFSGYSTVDFGGFKNKCGRLSEILEQCIDSLYDEQGKKEEVNQTPQHGTAPFHNAIHELYRLKSSVEEFSNFISSKTCLLVNNPFLILKGEAGYGKSHLLGDVAVKKANAGKKVLLLLGHHFTGSENPWYQVLHKYYNLQINEDDFLGQLNVKAHLLGERIVIIIDAINEGNGKEIWQDNLKSFINKVRQYDALGLIISIRTSYHRLLVDESIYKEDLAQSLTHYGFSEHEYEASDYFFDNYNIQKPRIPFLHPEFRSPLFLKLFCEGLDARGLHEIPEGYEGISVILDFFLEGINVKLAKRLQYDESINVVRKCIESFAKEVHHDGLGYMPYSKAVYFFNDLPELRIVPNAQQFTSLLVDEGVLSRNLYWNRDGSHEDGVFLLYERFLDHLVAAFLIKTMVDKPHSNFQQGGNLFDLFKDERSCNKNSGLIEAFSIQIPEKYGIEFFELIPHVKECSTVAEALITSIIWRKSSTFTAGEDGELSRYLKDIAFAKHGLVPFFLENILLISSVPGHPFNANYLHHKLMNQPLANRDAGFLGWLTDNYESDASAVRRIIDWGWKDTLRKHITDDSVLLSSTTLSWFLISPHREIRDSSTKAIICLLYNREYLIIDLLKRFDGVNDPYVYERLFCIAYGCTLRAVQHTFLQELSAYIFDHIFNQELVYPDILLRDYAKGVIAFAEKKNIPLAFGTAITKPPYRSEPITNCPSNEYIDTTFTLTEKDSGNYYYQNKILKSMITEYGRGIASYGDFGRYTFQSALYSWEVDANALSNFAVKRIFELGYDVKLHGQYDSAQPSGRDSGPKERIGKKYQWIALHEVLARTADHHQMINRSDRKSIIPYEGAWQAGIRDIDPSMVITKTDSEDAVSSESQYWWVKENSLNWNITNKEWMLLETDIPIVSDQLMLNDSEGKEWINLEFTLSKYEEKKLGDDPYKGPKKNFYMRVRAYLIADDQFEQFAAWCNKRNFSNEFLPEPPSQTQLFSREYYWSDAYQYFQQPYYGGNGDEDFYSQTTDEYIADLHLPVQLMYWEKSEDHSKSQVISFYRPSQKIYDDLNLQYAHKEGEFRDQNGFVACIDPSVNSDGPSCLLLRKDLLIPYLIENKLRICWIVWAEKQILSSNYIGDDDNPKLNHTINGFYFYENEQIQGGIRSDIAGY